MYKYIIYINTDMYILAEFGLKMPVGGEGTHAYIYICTYLYVFTYKYIFIHTYLVAVYIYIYEYLTTYTYLQNSVSGLR
jgi:hypothetical protein